MTIPASGPISASTVNVELGRASNAAFSINGASERALAGKPTGAISFSDFYGKSAADFTYGPLQFTDGGGITDLWYRTFTATAAFGTGPYTYSWSSTATLWSIGGGANPTNGSGSVPENDPPPSETADVTVVITDSLGANRSVTKSVNI